MTFFEQFSRLEGSSWEAALPGWRVKAPALSFRRFKRLIDIIGASIGVVFFGPLMLYIYLLLMFTGGQPIFAHRRLGKDGRDFYCYKFRSMVPNAEKVLAEYLAAHPEARAEWEERRKLANDPRVTVIGGFLRRKSLDELPQLFNVLKGDMSLVGPRPITRPEIKHYSSRIFRYCACRPGITGLWQVSGRNDVAFGDRVRLDERYVDEHNIWLDTFIIVRTIGVVLSGRGAS